MQKVKLEIGQKIYSFNINRRVYKEGQSGAVYADHFQEHTVTGEDDKSYHLDNGTFWTVNKRSGLLCRNQFYTEQQKNDRVWDNDNRWKIIEKIRSVDTETLRKIAELISI